MRGLEPSIYNPHPSPLPEGEGIFRGYHNSISSITLKFRVLCGLRGYPFDL